MNPNIHPGPFSISSRHSNSYPTIWESLIYPYQLDIEQDSAASGRKFILRCGIYLAQVQIDDEVLVKMTDDPGYQWLVTRTILDLRRELEENMEKGYDYPDIRNWAKLHFPSHSIHDGKIPGWVFQKWTTAHPGMKAVKTGGVVSIGDIGEPQMVTRKVAVKKGATTRNPGTVRKPFCPVHQSAVMVFNAIRSVWECQERDCHIIAQPKNEPEQGKILLGKGEISLRVVCREGEAPAIILISDDNVALDITNNVFFPQIANMFEMNDAVLIAVRAGLENASITIEKEISLKARASITNLSNWPNNIEPF